MTFDLFQFVPLIDQADADSSDFVKFLFVVDHFLAGDAGDDVVLAEEDGLLGADLFAHAVIDAADHVDIEFSRTLFNFGPGIIGGNLGGDDSDSLGWTDEFTKLA